MSIPVAPAPWVLTGRGLVVALGSDPALTRGVRAVAEPPGPLITPGVALLMVVRYAASPVGPYDELLFIPGLHRTPAGWRLAISHILVSTEASVENGRRNWGIPKERADFVFRPDGPGRESITVTREGRDVARLAVRTGAGAVPVSLGWLPGRVRRLVQRWDGRLLETELGGRGRGHPATLEASWFDGETFPDLSRATPRLAVTVDPFELHFPPARVVAEAR